jgi:hypothetical protein
MSIPRVVLREMSFDNAGYFDWLTTGLQMLAETGEIEYRFEPLPLNKARQMVPKLGTALKTYLPKWHRRNTRGGTGTMEGSVQVNGKSRSFFYDTGDTPFTIGSEQLQRCDLYFKCQHPAVIEESGYRLSREVVIPYDPAVLELRHKIRPAMLGRPLSRRLNYQKNLQVLRFWEALAEEPRRQRLHLYFGDDVPPLGEGVERYLLLFFRNTVHHPNYKRADLVRWAKQNLPLETDARIVRTKDQSIVGPPLSDEQFPKSVAGSIFNVNFTGLRRSLPFRFIDSFMVGTAVPTDELGVRWYLPFEQGVEVHDLGQLGYETQANAEWSKAYEVLRHLHANAREIHRANHGQILENYRRKWHPLAFARYIVRECVGQL